LNQKEQNFLNELVQEVRHSRARALVDGLSDEKVSSNKKRYILDCLKTIGSEEAMREIDKYAETIRQKERQWAITPEDEIETSKLRSYAEEIVAEEILSKRKTTKPTTKEPDVFADEESTPTSFRNPFEFNAEYILIPGGRYEFSVTQKEEQIPNLYFAKYPVTNKRYNRFIGYLRGDDLLQYNVLPLKKFQEELQNYAPKVKGYEEYLGLPKQWANALKSKEDDKKFLGDDQPVARVTWFDATAYCFWLTLLDMTKEQALNYKDAKSFYRLPHEKEWEWAAAGRGPNGSLREYPWPKEKGGPNSKLANYENKVGATTPVGRYPNGATPDGLHDMAGNVWEWMANWSSNEKKYRSLRGGSWGYSRSWLRCSARSSDSPDYNWNLNGFRVVLSESKALDTL
jgi:formylglycine-generating enzyme required for sulfatase activity